MSELVLHVSVVEYLVNALWNKDTHKLYVVVVSRVEMADRVFVDMRVVLVNWKVA